MDNQLFPGGGAFLDDMAQGCPLCGVMFNNTLAYQHHMQLHILSANAILGNQPPPDPGISMPTPSTILDLMGGVSQHPLSTGSGMPMVSQQAIFSGAAGSMPPHLISQGLIPGTLPSMGLPQHPSVRPKEKKLKSQNIKSTSTSSITSAAPPIQRPSGPGTFKPQENSSSTYISTFPKDLQKMELIAHKSPNAQHSQSKIPTDVFPSTASHIDPLESLILPSPIKAGPPVFERQLSKKSNTSASDSGGIINKDSKKLFQPFVSVDSSVTAGYVTKSNTHFTSDNLLSPVKSGPVKPPLLDVLSTPQKISYHSNNENLFTSPQTLPNTSSGDIRHFGMFQDPEITSVPVERNSDLPAKIVPHDHDKLSSKSQYFSDIDPLNVSPKAGQSARKKDIDSMIKMPIHQASLDHSQSSSPVPRPTLPGDFAPFRADSVRAMVSPKVSPAIPPSAIDTDSTSLSLKPHLFGGAAGDVLPTGNVPSSTPPVFSTTATSNAGGLTSLTTPAMDIAVNPLGTGYFNALTQKFIDPTFNLAGDFNKPGSSTAGGLDDQKQKIYFENGVIMNQDYDKISDTNDEDNLERLIEDIDTKSEPIIDKGYSEIEDLLNEFNEKQEDMKNKSHMDDFMKNDDFLKTVMEDSSKSKVDKPETSVKVDEPTFNPPEEFEMNKSIITDILEQEKERIEKESTELENARLSSLINTSTATSSSVTISSATATSTVTSVSNTEPKVSSTVESEEKKDDDHVDFEIPKVGKLMKIRKYFQIQEQKRKEQTEKVTEVRVHEKTEAPPADDKPQTILVQVSKRKKIEYGPYLNRQSLLEGKPKANIETTSPPKTYRPKPKPPLPEKRTFNLRERKTKTDFATLASKGSRTAETKKPETKQKAIENAEKDTSGKEDGEEVTEKEVNDSKEEIKSKDQAKIVTRHQEKKKEVDSSEKKKETDGQVEKGRSKGGKIVNKQSNENDKDNENETKQKDIKSSLRTRSAKNEENAESTPRTRNSKNDAENTDGKNLRKRSIKAAGTGDASNSKVKVKKTEESVTVVTPDTEPKANIDSETKISSDSMTKINSESEEKVTRSKSKIKTTPEKSGIKKCSVNLGEKYNDIKARSLFDKMDNKEGKSVISLGKSLAEELGTKMDVDDSEIVSEKSEIKSDKMKKTDESNKEALEEKELSYTHEKMEVCDVHSGEKAEQSVDIKENVIKYKGDKKELENADHKEGSNVPQKVGKRSSRNRHEKGSRKESNIFENIDHTQKISIRDESQMVSITSTDNTDKKVTMKLKLSPNFQKAFKLFNPKKRKHEAASNSGQSNDKEAKKEQKLDKESRKELKANREIQKELNESKGDEKAIDAYNDPKIEEYKNENKMEEKIIVDQNIETKINDEKHSKTEERNMAEEEIKDDTNIVNETQEMQSFIEEPVKDQNMEKKFKHVYEIDTWEAVIPETSFESKSNFKKSETSEKITVQNTQVTELTECAPFDKVNKDNSGLESLEDKSSCFDFGFNTNSIVPDSVQLQEKEKEINLNVEKAFGKEIKVEKKVKHSVENEFQRLVNEAMAEAQKEGETAKSKNLRKRINENVKYNLDDSEDELDKIKLLHEGFNVTPKGRTTPKGSKAQGKGSKGKSKLEVIDTLKQQQAKKEGDVYDFTDTEMSDSEESPKKLGFKPKYVSNLNLFGQKKLPFVSKPMSPVETLQSNENSETVPEVVDETVEKRESESENADASISYERKTVEPLKIKLTKIIPFKEKKHKHKKKKRKREKERKEDEMEKYDSESRDSFDSVNDKKVGENKDSYDSCIDRKMDDVSFKPSEFVTELESNDVKKIEDVKSVDSMGQESNSNSNEGEDDQNDSGLSGKSNKRAKLKEKKHICEYCNVGFGQKCDLRRHIMIHTGERPYPCQICDKRFQRKTDLNKHTRTHTGEKPYACEFCDKRVSDKSQLNVHRRLHTGDRPYCCSKCGKRCITSSELSRHKAVHCGEKVERCNLCKKAFTIKECLGMHMKLHYRSRGKLLRCEKCAIGFDKKIDLDNHHCVDPMKNVYVCSECYEEFNDEMLYAEHIKTHDLGVLACNVCTKIFEDKHSLETHLCSMGVDKQKQLACEICETEFQDQDSLSLHVATHDNDFGSFSCDFCSETFKVRRKFMEHSRLHDPIIGPSVGNSPRNSGVPVTPSQSYDTGQSPADASMNNSDSRMGGADQYTTIKQEVESSDFHFLTSGSENILNRKDNSVSVKSEQQMGPGLPSNRSRASVISGTFRIDDEGGDSRHSNTHERVNFQRSNIRSDSLVNLPDKSDVHVNRNSISARSPDFLPGDRFFEPADFTNSPDFSTLTESDDLDLSPFESVSNSLNQDSEKSVKINQNLSAKQIDSIASTDLKQKIMKRFGTNSQPYGTIPVPKSRVSTSQGAMHPTSARNMPLQNSQISALLSSTSATHSSDHSQGNNRGNLHRSVSTGHTSQFQSSQNNLGQGEGYQQNSQNKRWSGFQISDTDFSFLGESSNKPEHFNQGLSKSMGNTVNRSDSFNKDNIENQIKSEMFPDFDISPNKPSLSSNYGNNSAGTFPGVSTNAFSPRQFIQNFSEKSDFSSYSQPYIGNFPHSQNMNSNSLKSSVNPDGQYSLDSSVTPDVNKRHLQGIYAGRSDILQNTPFYLPGVDDTMKDLTGNDKDETTALLSNFDQF